jgi:hypothetical protein
MMIKVLAALVSALLTFVGAGPLYRVQNERSITKTLRFSGAGVPTLDVRTVKGSIRVVGYDGADVQLEVRQSIAAETDDDLRAAEREAVLDTVENGSNIEAIVRQSGRAACEDDEYVHKTPWWELRTPWWDRRRYEATYDFTIRVPRNTRLRLCTMTGGEVRVDDTAGDFDINSINGRITLDRMRGSGRAVSVNGRVTVSFDAPPRADSFFKTINGHIVATFPAGLSADLRMKTFNGGLFTDFDVQTQTTVPVAERRDGKFVYRSNDFTAVRVGRGGPSLTFDAFNGDVRILRASR